MHRLKRRKLSLMIHYGLYSLLGGEWHGQTVPWYAEWIRHTAKIPREAYRALQKDFTASRFDAEGLVCRAKALGFESICFTAKHHDGFCLFHSEASDFCSEHDLVGALAEACRAHAMPLSLYYSQAQDWDDERAYRAYDALSGAAFSEYFYDKCLPQVEELLTRYGPIEGLWFDTPDRMTRDQAVTLRRTVKTLQPDCLINGRIGHGLGDYAVCQDNMLPSVPWDIPWEVPVSLYDSWGFKRSRSGEKSPNDLLRIFLKTLSRGGHCLLNVGPEGDGSISDEDMDLLSCVCEYALDKAPAVYGTVPAPLPLFECEGMVMTWKPEERRLFLHIFDQDPNHPMGRHDLIGFDADFTGMNRVLDGKIGDPVPAFGRRTLEGDPCWTFDVPVEPRVCLALTYAGPAPRVAMPKICDSDTMGMERMK